MSKFEFSGPPETLAQAVQEAVGAASMAWVERPQGVFDDQWALAVSGGLIAWIEANYERKSPALTGGTYVPGQIQFGDMTLPGDYPPPPAGPQPGSTVVVDGLGNVRRHE